MNKPLPNRRYLALFFPMLSADRWLREGRGEGRGEYLADQTVPLAFVQKQRGAMRIVAVGEVALSLGISPGMMLADARARVSDIVVIDQVPDADAALLVKIADDLDRYTPMVALDPPDGLILDISGCAHLWEGEADLVSDLATRLAQAGFTVRLALAETPDKARALARHGGEVLNVRRGLPPSTLQEERVGYQHQPLIPSEDEGLVRAEPRTVEPSCTVSRLRSTESLVFARDERISYVAEPNLPIAALDLDEDRSTALRRAGLYTIADLASRPRGPLAARFGMEAVTKLARVLGEEDRHITPRRVPPALFILRRFAEPVAHSDFILGAIGELAEDARTTLRERGQGGRRFTISLFRSDGDTRRLTIETGAPTRDPALLLRLFRERIDALSDPLDPGFGYDAVRLDVGITEALGAAQIGLEGGEDVAARIAGLTDQIAVRLGQRRVRRFASGNSHIPECAGLTLPAHAPPLPFAWRDVEPGEPPLRPLHLFDPPHRIEVIAEVPDGPPRRFRWRRRMHEVTRFEGPERISSEWWKRKTGYEAGKGGLTRDYFRVEDAKGHRFWLFRHGLYGAEKQNPDWYLHGTFG
jgi:protein ImuB